MKIKQLNLINSLKENPLIILIRLENDFFYIPQKRENLLLKIQQLYNYGIKNIEIGWDSNPEWINLINEIKNKFEYINIGAASISSREAFNSIIELNLNYSMSPFFYKELHLKAIEHNQLLIPGISNIKNLNEAINLGYKAIKIFPASKLGINFITNLKEFRESGIFFIAAGGIKSDEIEKWLKHGYNALVIGRALPNHTIDDNLKIWLKNQK